MAITTVALGAYAYDSYTAASRQNQSFVNMDTNALIAVIENPGTEAGIAANSAIGERNPIVSHQAARDFLVKGNPAELGTFMVEQGGVMRPAPASSTVSGIMARGIDEADAKIIGAGAEVGVRTLTRDDKMLAKTPELTEEYLWEHIMS